MNLQDLRDIPVQVAGGCLGVRSGVLKSDLEGRAICGSSACIVGNGASGRAHPGRSCEEAGEPCLERRLEEEQLERVWVI